MEPSATTPADAGVPGPVPEDSAPAAAAAEEEGGPAHISADSRGQDAGERGETEEAEEAEEAEDQAGSEEAEASDEEDDAAFEASLAHSGNVRLLLRTVCARSAGGARRPAPSSLRRCVTLMRVTRRCHALRVTFTCHAPLTRRSRAARDSALKRPPARPYRVSRRYRRRRPPAPASPAARPCAARPHCWRCLALQAQSSEQLLHGLFEQGALQLDRCGCACVCVVRACESNRRPLSPPSP
jgi:hypothetical protein